MQVWCTEGKKWIFGWWCCDFGLSGASGLSGHRGDALWVAGGFGNLEEVIRGASVSWLWVCELPVFF